MVGVSTMDCQVTKAQRDTNQLLRKYRNRIKRGDRSAVWELLDLNPEFISVDWVAEQVLRLRNSRQSERRRGRPLGRYGTHPLIVVGLVNQLISARQVENREQAFGKLEELELLSYDSAKTAYYRGLANKNIRAHFLERREKAQIVSEQEVIERLCEAHILQPGNELSYEMGGVQATFHGLPTT